MKKMITISAVLVGIVFLAGCGQQSAVQIQPTPVAEKPVQTETSQPVATQPAPAIVDSVPKDWKVYANKDLGIEMKYPDKKLLFNKSDKATLLIEPTDPKGSTKAASNIMDFYAFKGEAEHVKSLNDFIERNKAFTASAEYASIDSSGGHTWYCRKDFVLDKSAKYKRCETDNANNEYKIGVYLSDEVKFFTEQEFDQIVKSIRFTN